MLPGVEQVQRPAFTVAFAHDDRAGVRPGLEPLARQPEFHAREVQAGGLASGAGAIAASDLEAEARPRPVFES